MNGVHVLHVEPVEYGRQRPGKAHDPDAEDIRKRPVRPRLHALRLLLKTADTAAWTDDEASDGDQPSNRPDIWMPLLEVLHRDAEHRAAMLAATGEILRGADARRKERILVAWSQVLIFGGNPGLVAMTRLLAEGAAKPGTPLWMFSGKLLDRGLLCRTAQGRPATRTVALLVLRGEADAAPRQQRGLFRLLLDRLRLEPDDPRHEAYRDLMRLVLSDAGDRFTAAATAHRAGRPARWHWLEELVPSSDEQRAGVLLSSALYAPDAFLRQRAVDRLDAMLVQAEGPRRAALHVLEESDFLVRCSRVVRSTGIRPVIDPSSELERVVLHELRGERSADNDPRGTPH